MPKSIFNHIVGIFDSPEFADRYTIAFDWVDAIGRREVLSLSDDPGSPRGVISWGSMRDSDINDLTAITKNELPGAVVKYLELLEVRPSGRVDFKKSLPESSSISTPTNPKDRIIDATELAHQISTTLIDAATKAWEDRIDYLQQGLPQSETWPAQELNINIRNFERMVGAPDYSFGKHATEIQDHIITIANRPANKFSRMPERSRPEEPWANGTILNIFKNISVLERDMIKSIYDFLSLH